MDFYDFLMGLDIHGSIIAWGIISLFVYAAIYGVWARGLD